MLLGDQALAERRLRRHVPEVMREWNGREREEPERGGADPRVAPAEDHERSTAELHGDRAEREQPGWIEAEMHHFAERVLEMPGLGEAARPEHVGRQDGAGVEGYALRPKSHGAKMRVRIGITTQVSAATMVPVTSTLVSSGCQLGNSQLPSGGSVEVSG